MLPDLFIACRLSIAFHDSTQDNAVQVGLYDQHSRRPDGTQAGSRANMRGPLQRGSAGTLHSGYVSDRRTPVKEKYTLARSIFRSHEISVSVIIRVSLFSGLIPKDKLPTAQSIPDPLKVHDG